MDDTAAEPRRDAIVVTGVRDGSYPNGVSRDATIGVLGERDLIDTPISAKSFTGEFIANQIAFTSDDLVVRDASVNLGANVALSGSDNGIIRGFRSNAYESSFDGFTNVMNRRVPLEFLDRVDILKGPLTFYGGVRFFGGPGGTINYVSRKPLDEPVTRFIATFSGRSQLGGQADVSRRFGADKAFGVRATLAYRDGETATDGVNEENRVGHIAFGWRSDFADVNVQYGHAYARVDGASDGIAWGPGVPIGPAPEAGSFRGPDWAFGEYDYEFARATLNVRPAEGWTIFASAGASAYTEEFLNLQVGATDTEGNFTATYYPQFGRADWGDFWSADVGVRGRVQTGPLTHNLTVSYGYNKYFEAFRGVAFPTEVVSGNIYEDSVFDQPAPVLQDDGIYYPLFDNRGQGVLVADEIGVLDDRILVTLGARWSNIRQEFFAFAAPTADGRPVRIYDESRWTPAVGVLFKPAPNISIYGNYLEALERGAIAPANAVNAGASTPPAISNQIEAGVKAEFAGFGATAAVFQIERPSAFLDPVSGEFGLFGLQRHRGIEFDVFGEPVPGVRLYGSYAYLDATLASAADPALEGNRPVAVPEHTLAAGLDVDLFGVPGLAALANVRHLSRQFYDAQNERAIPAFTIFDAGLRYGFMVGETRLTARLNVNNLFDEDYYVSANFTTGPGAPRTVRASLAVDF